MDSTNFTVEDEADTSLSDSIRGELPSQIALKSIQGPSLAREDARYELAKVRRRSSMSRRMSMMTKNRVEPLMTQPQIMTQRLSNHNIELGELGFEVCQTEEDQRMQLERLRDMPCPIAVKRLVRKKILNQEVTSSSGFKGWKFKQAKERKRIAQRFKDIIYKLELWKDSFKEIEGHFGTGVLSYFVFLKWLFQLNIVIFLLIITFIVIPQAVLGVSDQVASTPCSGINNSLYSSLEYNGDIVPNCSADYQDYIQLTSGAVNGTYEVVSYIADFFQGTGFMENTALFYGYYSSSALTVDIQGVSKLVDRYNLPLAYILVTVTYFLLSFFLMVRQSAQGYKDSIISTDSKFYQYCNKVFGSWDFALSDARNVILKKKSIYQDIMHDLNEEKDTLRREARSTVDNCKLYTIRICVNLFVLAALGGAGYLIYYVTDISSEIIKTRPEYLTWTTALQLLVQFLPSFTITALNILVPLIFEKIVLLEDYIPSTEVQLTLFRTVLLRLSSLTVLFITLYSEINCDSKNYCNVGDGSCQPLYCWETGVGQELYKLVVVDMIVQLAITIFVEFPRKLIVSKCTCKLAKIIGCQQFLIPKNVLDLVYSQTLCWLGAFFSPLIPAICVLKMFILFYFKKISLLSNFVPNNRPYRASRSNALFIVVLLVSFMICCFPVIYVIAIMTPSRGCGPFRPYGVMYDAIIATICEWPEGFQTFLTVVSSTGFSIPLVMALCVTIYYLQIMVQAQKKRVSLLRDQLMMEGKDKQFLLSRITDIQGKGTTASQLRSNQKALSRKPNNNIPSSLLSAAEVVYEEVAGEDV
ncbi:TMC7 [Bugula neritina]|uniref:TMC7 n=1 Tax=Bugula neritina TaxID=10212 RepID=A0A7J7J2T6_BUGNE|nr:TMC7 [Bugula neritina]